MGAKAILAIILLIGACVFGFFVWVGWMQNQRVYVSSGTVSSTTYMIGGLSFEYTRIRFIATDFKIDAYGNHPEFQVGHKYEITYTYDFNDYATIVSYKEIP